MPEVWSSSPQTRATQHGRSTGSVREPRFHFSPCASGARMPNPALGRRSTVREQAGNARVDEGLGQRCVPVQPVKPGVVSPTPLFLLSTSLEQAPRGREQSPYTLRLELCRQKECSSTTLRQAWVPGAQQGIPRAVSPDSASTSAAPPPQVARSAGLSAVSGASAQSGRARVNYGVPAPWGATVNDSDAVRLMYIKMVSSWEGSAAGRGVPMLPQSAEPRRARRTERSSAAATGPTQVTGRVHSHRSGAIPEMGISGATRLPAGLFRAAPSARGPGEEPARGPGKQTHQPRPRAPARQVASSSSAPEATPVVDQDEEVQLLSVKQTRQQDP
ncbi:hypothetical protein NDU88_002712 [Pleurodeles waltl]|uniref:Uncharacterized protein n=1 Tax=Pleurodeles waltl TaxID=8319 RepID=A0AAV7LDA4_PLEWA|nr:hypothetical protein NDU88_002712 [Pleurodeles waltl]